mgnify:CR=1 FL=1
MKFLKEKLLTSDFGILLSLGTVFGYGLYYVNELGFDEYYGLPSNYISFNLSDLALCIIVTCMIMIYIYFSYETLIYMFSDFIFSFFNHRAVKYTLVTISVLLSIVFWFGYGILGIGAGHLTSNQRMFLFLLTCLFDLYFFWAVFKNYSVILVLCIHIAFAGFIAKEVGIYRAEIKDHYLIIEKKDKYYAVINNYNNKFIIAPVDLEKGIVSSKFQFIEMKSDNDNKLELISMNTGKLRAQSYKFKKK